MRIGVVLEECGLQPDLAIQISELPFEGLHLLSIVGSRHIHFNVNPALRDCLPYVYREIWNRQLKDEYFLGDAPAPLMDRLFGIKGNDYTARRKALGLPKKNRGRHTDPSPSEQRIVMEALHEPKLASLPLEMRLLKVREKTGG